MPGTRVVAVAQLSFTGPEEVPDDCLMQMENCPCNPFQPYTRMRYVLPATKLPGATFSVADKAISEQAILRGLVQLPEKTSTTGSKTPEGVTITESPLPTATNENQTSLAEVEVNPPQVAGLKLWVAAVLSNVCWLHATKLAREMAELQLSLAGWAMSPNPGIKPNAIWRKNLLFNFFIIGIIIRN